ncbi:HlyD family secretion protein [Chloroflexota bacterium]
MQNQRRVFLALLLVLLLVLSCGTGESSETAESISSAELAGNETDVISATGEVRPARWAELSFPVGGTVSSVHVQEGADVQGGQLVMEVSAVQLGRAVAEAQAALLAAEADLARVKGEAHPQDVAAAEEAVAAALANVSIAEAQVLASEAELSRAQDGVAISQAQVDVAKAGTAVARAELVRAQAGTTSQELASAKAGVDRAQAAVQQAQTAYDRAGGTGDTLEALALEQATLDLRIAQAEHSRLLAGPRQSDLAPARASVQAAQAQETLAKAQAALAESQVTQAQAAVAQSEASVEGMKAQVAQAQAALDRLKAGPSPEEVAVAEAFVARARETLVTAQESLGQAKLTAPFGGTVGMIHVQEGEEVLPGQPVLVAGDLTTLRVETTDLDEIDVARVQPGQQADLTFDALPEKTLRGRVVRVAPMSTPGQAAVSYAVIIEFEETDPALRWGMTAFVDISVE